jgi:hypothetical protein
MQNSDAQGGSSENVSINFRIDRRETCSHSPFVECDRSVACSVAARAENMKALPFVALQNTADAYAFNANGAHGMRL